MPFNPNHKGHYQVADDMLVSYKPWAPRVDGDQLWRTALGYIVYAEPDLLYGIDRCFRLENGGIQVYRSPSTTVNDVSRDQVVMALVAMRMPKYFVNIHSLLEFDYSARLKWRLSDKFTMTPDMWLWVKRKYITFQLVTLLLLLVVIPWNAMVRPIVKALNWYRGTELLYPQYTLFILAWMLQVTPKNGLRTLVSHLAALDVEKDNHVLRLLLGKPVSAPAVQQYKSIHGFRWNRRLDLPTRLYIVDTSAEPYNNIDMDLLDYLIKN